MAGAEAFTSFSSRRFSALPTDAVQSILTCTLKISAFYGLYTWLTHTLFGINFVVIPSGVLRCIPYLQAFIRSDKSMPCFYRANKHYIIHVYSLKYKSYTISPIQAIGSITVPYSFAVTAAVFAAVPFITTYWAALPAVLELLLVRGNVPLALLLFVLHVAPSSFVEPILYSTIKCALQLLLVVSLWASINTYKSNCLFIQYTVCTDMGAIHT